MKLRKRLSMVASFVRQGGVIADIGTDHAYLPAYLILKGVCDNAYAADIGKGPLLNAKETVEEYDLEDKIKLVLSDGLKNVPLEKTDTVVLAGMGGDLIRDILSYPDIDCLRKLHIIAQPQSHSEKVRLFFMNNGFEIEREDICLDSKHIYICMSAVFTGRTDYPDSYEYYGELIKNESELVGEYLGLQLMHMKKKRDAFLKSGCEKDAQALGNVIANIEKAMGER